MLPNAETMLTVRFTVPRNDVVVFQRPDGSFLSEGIVDSSGAYTAPFIPGGFVSALAMGIGLLIFSRVPGSSDIVIHTATGTVCTGGRSMVAVNFPPSLGGTRDGFSYGFHTLTSGFQNGDYRATEMVTACGDDQNQFNAIATAYRGGVLAATSVLMVPLPADGATVSMPAWDMTLPSVSVTLSGVAPTADLSFRIAPVINDQIFFFSASQIVPNTGSTVQFMAPWIGGLPDTGRLSLSSATPSQEFGLFRQGAIPPSLTFDLAALPSVTGVSVDHSDGARPLISWELGTGGTPDAVRVQGPFLMYAPPCTDPVRFPELPESLARFRPVGGFFDEHYQVSALNAAGAEGYAAFLASGVLEGIGGDIAIDSGTRGCLLPVGTQSLSCKD